MSHPPGLPRLSIGYGVFVAVLLVCCAIAQGLMSSPVLVGIAIEYPPLFGWAVLAFIGWIVLYTSDIIQVLRFDGWEPFREIQESMTRSDWLVSIVLIIVYLNVVVGIGAWAAFVVNSVTGLPLLGLLIALVYANADLHLGARWYSPGGMILRAILEVFHVFGAYRDLTAEYLLESLQLRSQVPEYGARPS